MFSREPKIRLSDVATFIAAAKELFEAGVEAGKPGPVPEQFIMSPEQIAEEQKRMGAEAAWIVSGGETKRDDDEPEED